MVTMKEIQEIYLSCFALLNRRTVCFKENSSFISTVFGHQISDLTENPDMGSLKTYQ